MKNKIKEIKDLYDFEGLFNLYYEWLDNNNYDKPLSCYEVIDYLIEQDVEEKIKQLANTKISLYDYYEFDGYMNLCNIGTKSDIIDNRALCEPEFVDYVYEEIKEEV